MSSMSKRAQARTERELQDILALPGNSTCADCGARNPAWASWSIGIFLCMRCATLHRKLGTHISKVKSLSMDTWSNEQVESMRQNGNLAVNKIYNPKNRNPDIPIDADEVDNAMERFIRKKYQEKSLSDGRPEVPSRDEPPVSRTKSPDIDASPLQPPKKKGLLTVLGLRASSSAYPLSKHDKKHRAETRTGGVSRYTSEDYSSKSQLDSRAGGRKDISEHELEAKLSQLRDMGFTDTEKNTKLLKKTRGDVELVIASLVKQSSREKESGYTTGNSTSKAEKPSNAKSSVPEQVPPPISKSASSNPFDALDNKPQQSAYEGAFGTAQVQAVQQHTMANTNPWHTAPAGQHSTGLEQSFASMHVVPPTQPLFPHNTGGYATQQHDPRYFQSMTPPVPPISQAYSATASPVSTNNPFMQTMPLSAHSTGSNPYSAHMQNMPSFVPSTNPFLNNQSSSSQPTSPGLVNPFGLPPRPDELHANMQATNPQFQSSSSNPHSSMQGWNQQQAQNAQAENFNQFQNTSGAILSPGFPNFHYGQAPATYTQQVMSQHPGFQGQISEVNKYSQQQNTPSILPQQTGRYDKSSILALYNHPQFAPPKPLAPITEPADAGQVESAQNQQPATVFGQKRSVTMPVAATGPTASLQNSRNPFLTNTAAVAANSSTHSTPTLPQFSPLAAQTPSMNPYQKQMASANPYHPQVGARHASADSVSVNNPNLMDGRHSPDAWGGLSARYH